MTSLHCESQLFTLFLTFQPVISLTEDLYHHHLVLGWGFFGGGGGGGFFLFVFKENDGCH